MSLVSLPALPSLARAGAGRHRGRTATELRRDNARMRANECELIQALVRLGGDLGAVLDENEQLKARVKELGDRVIQQSADTARLRKALIDARPKIYVVPSQMVRPFAPEVVLPYVPPIPPSDASNDDKQPLAVLDQPGREAA